MNKVTIDDLFHDMEEIMDSTSNLLRNINDLKITPQTLSYFNNQFQQYFNEGRTLYANGNRMDHEEFRTSCLLKAAVDTLNRFNNKENKNEL